MDAAAQAAVGAGNDVLSSDEFCERMMRSPDSSQKCNLVFIVRALLLRYPCAYYGGEEKYSWQKQILRFGPITSAVCCGRRNFCVPASSIRRARYPPQRYG